MRIITLVLELAVLCLSLSSPTCSLPTVMDNPRDLDNDPQSEQLDPGDSMNELPSADIPEAIPQTDIASVAPGATLDVSDVPADFDLPPSSWGTPSTEQLPDPTRPENTETAEPTKKPETSNVDSTGKTNSDNTGPSSQQGSEPNKQPTVNVPFDPDTPADEQIIKNTWKFRDNYKLKGPSDFSFTPWSYKIPADVQIQQNQYSDLSRSKGPTTVEWSDTIPLSDQQREIMRQAERKLLNEACKAAQALGKPIDCL